MRFACQVSLSTATARPKACGQDDVCSYLPRQGWKLPVQYSTYSIMSGSVISGSGYNRI